MKPRGVLSTVALWGLLLAVVFWSVVPILFFVMSSFKDPKAILEYPPRIVFSPTVRNYTSLLHDWPSYFRGLANSAIITSSAVTIVLLLSTLGAFTFSRYSRLRTTRMAALFMIAIRMLPPIIITIPLFPVLRSLGLVDRHVTVILLYAAFTVSLGTWIMKSFIDDIPRELEEAALVDGCSPVGAFFRVTAPLAAPGIVTTAIFAAIFCWNEFTFAFIFAPSKARTAPVAISEMLGSVEGVAWGPLFAATVLQLAPMLVLTWALQRYMVKGMTLGAVKQ